MVRAKIAILIIFLACSQEPTHNEARLRQEILRAYPGADKIILDAFFAINRRALLPGIRVDELYRNKTHKIGYGQISSKPHMNIVLAQELQPEKHHRVLEIGTGSGIQAALLSALCREVYTVEVSHSLMSETKDRLMKLGYRNIEIRQGDGYYGWPGKGQTFDRILLTCSFPEVPPALKEQLREGGYLLMPRGEPFKEQKLQRYVKRRGRLILHSVIRDVVFVPLLKH